MNSVKNIMIYHWKTLLKSLLIMLAVIFGILAFIKIISASTSGNSNVSFGSMDLILGVFAFVFFIANFKISFNHLISNGITRKKYFVGTLVFSIFSSICLLIISIITILACKALNFNIDYLYLILYSDLSNLESIALVTSIIILLSILGWLVGVLSCRYGTPMILALIFTPQILITVVALIVDKLDIIEPVSKVAMFYFGILDTPAPLVASMNFILTSAILSVITWLFMRKMPVKV